MVFWHSGGAAVVLGVSAVYRGAQLTAARRKAARCGGTCPALSALSTHGEPPPLSGAVLGVGDSTSAVGRWCAHGELPLSPRTGFPRCCASAARWWETVTVGGWADMPEELLEKLLEVLEAVG